MIVNPEIDHFTYMKVIGKKEPIRLFVSNRLEKLTHLSPIITFSWWMSVIIVTLVFAVSAIFRTSEGATTSFGHVPAGFFIGMFVWTLGEYLLHRFVFHLAPRRVWRQRLSFFMHGVHHAQPNIRTRLFMPPPVSIPLAALFFGLFFLIAGVVFGAPHWTPALFAGYVAGYLAYSSFHFGMHQWKVNWRWFVYIRRHHMLHHGSQHDYRFGVSSPLWDYVFGTMPPKRIGS